MEVYLWDTRNTIEPVLQLFPEGLDIRSSPAAEKKRRESWRRGGRVAPHRNYSKMKCARNCSKRAA